MSEEIEVSIQSDIGTKNQWAKGLFYRQDGRKRILIPKRLLYVAGFSFAVLTTAIIIQGTPDSKDTLESQRRSSAIASPDTLATQTVTNIPTAAQGEAVITSSSATTTTVTGKSGDSKKQFGRPQLVLRPKTGKIPPGSFLKATLLSGASNGPARAEVTEELILNGETLVEQGAILIGSGQSGEDRLAIRFSQIVHKDGAFDTIDGQACDATDKIPGIKASAWGSKVGNQAVKLATGIGLNFAGGLTTALQDTQSAGGALFTRPTLRNAMLNGAATAALDQGREVMSDVRNKQPVIEVPAGTPLFILMQGN